MLNRTRDAVAPLAQQLGGLLNVAPPLSRRRELPLHSTIPPTLAPPITEKDKLGVGLCFS